jgi:hypothetical protein
LGGTRGRGGAIVGSDGVLGKTNGLGVIVLVISGLGKDLFGSPLGCLLR